MLALFGLASLTAGLILAARAPLYPEWTARLEMAGGGALVAGLATVGIGLKVACC